MQDDQRISVGAIWEAAVDAVESAAPKTRAEIAEEMGVSATLVSKALGRPNTRYLRFQRRLIEHLTGYRIEGPFYVAVKKEPDEEAACSERTL